MMLRTIALPVIVGVFSSAACAGLFDSNDFKCGREDAVNALAEHIKNDAAGLLQSDFLTKRNFSYDKPLSAYQSILNSIAVNVTNVSTDGNGSNGLNCTATIALKIPQEALDVVSSDPDYLSSVTGAYGKINNGSVVWRDVNYSAKLADNNKDIIFSAFNRTDISHAMFNSSVLTANKDQIVKSLNQNSLEIAQSAYAYADRELNATWKALPDSARNALKKEQQAWVNDKARKCGKLSDASSEAMNASQRADIYQCQTKMTNERIDYLSGNNN